MKIKQHWQAAKLTPCPKKYKGKDWDHLVKYTKAKKGRPNRTELNALWMKGYNYVWLYTKIKGQPELVDGVVLDG